MPEPLSVNRQPLHDVAIVCGDHTSCFERAEALSLAITSRSFSPLTQG